ncbi:helix-turn-helix transcriptional regulator [Mesorhizobium sp. M6A.T.Ca.TU.002.02.2.1]|nr:helix-turn-helix transcriptional regulator [Mesorhizobium sp. M6A.T.Ca.TU.002.02.2.1]
MVFSDHGVELRNPNGVRSSLGTTEETFADRFRQALGAESPHAFAQRVEISNTMVQKYLKLGSMPGLDMLLKIAEGTGATLDWLATGKGPMRAGEPATGLMVTGEAPEGFFAVPKLDIRPSAGAGTMAFHDDGEPDIVAFREDWLRRLGISPKYARLMVAQGDSMRETINDGDLMIVDISIREFIDEAIYVLVYGGLVRLKRLQMLRSGVLLLKSDNAHYETEEVPLPEQPELIIGGRVRWVGGSV